MTKLALIMLFGVLAVSVDAQNYGSLSSRLMASGGQQSNQYGQLRMPPSPPTIQQDQYGQMRPTFPLRHEESSSKTVSPCDGLKVGDKLADTIQFQSNQFIHCEEEGQYKVMRCPESLVFNPNTDRCENTLKTSKACLSSPCKNNGVCADMPKFSFICECPAGFGGELCERAEVCPPGSCGPDDTCVILAPGAPVPKYCITSVERNLCAISEALIFYSSSIHPSLFIHCEGDNVHIKFCSDQLVFNQQKQICDWEAGSSSSLSSFSSSQYDNSYAMQNDFTIQKVALPQQPMTLPSEEQQLKEILTRPILTSSAPMTSPKQESSNIKPGNAFQPNFNVNNIRPGNPFQPISNNDGGSNNIRPGNPFQPTSNNDGGSDNIRPGNPFQPISNNDGGSDNIRPGNPFQPISNLDGGSSRLSPQSPFRGQAQPSTFEGHRLSPGSAFMGGISTTPLRLTNVFRTKQAALRV